MCRMMEQMDRFGTIFFGIALLVVVLRADQTAWDSFKQEYGKHYKNIVDEAVHMKVFLDNLDEIFKHNELFKAGKVSYEMGINEFSDMTDDEFYSTMTGFVPDNFGIEEEADRLDMPNDDVEIPAAVDWRTKGAVTSVKNQGQCGSCWAFGALGALEGQYFLKTGQLISLSPQNLIDCVKKDAKKCYGGNFYMAYGYLLKNAGVESEKTYPYTGKKGQCKYNPKNSVAKINGFRKVAQNEKALTQAIATVGPISVGINTKGLKQHKNGTYFQPNCPTGSNHVVLAVGYGSDKNGDYYIIKNSWGPKWGEKGFFKMARNRNDNCGITRNANYPMV